MPLKKALEVKEVIEIALNYFRTVFSNRLESLTNVLLEEIYIHNYNDIADCWFVTIGFDEIFEPTGTSADLYEPFGPRPHRKFKTVILDKYGNVQGLRIREVEIV
jgi:hypothetical protein